MVDRLDEGLWKRRAIAPTCLMQVSLRTPDRMPL